MVPYFNTSGPCIAGRHHMLPPDRRLTRAMDLIEQGRYFVLRSGRQTGKTTCARWLEDHYNADDRYAALWIDIQVAREQPAPEKAFRAIFSTLDQWVNLVFPELGLAEQRQRWLEDPLTAVQRYLGDLSARLGRPLIVFFDEADGLVGDRVTSPGTGPPFPTAWC
jgi:type II secretory pathway predicted ATPase ExeA